MSEPCQVCIELQRNGIDVPCSICDYGQRSEQSAKAGDPSKGPTGESAVLGAASSCPPIPGEMG